MVSHPIQSSSKDARSVPTQLYTCDGVADFVSGNTSKLSNNDGGMQHDVAAAAATTTLSLLLLLLLTPLFDPPASSSSAVDFVSIRLSRSESITCECKRRCGGGGGMSSLPPLPRPPVAVASPLPSPPPCRRLFFFCWRPALLGRRIHHRSFPSLD